MSVPTLVIGLDAATMDLIEPWVDEGRLPAIGRLVQNGASGRLLSTPNMHSASAWTSILTGLNPGRHGLFVFSDRDHGTGKQVFFRGGDRTGELITGFLSKGGLSSGLVNVPMTYPAECPGRGFVVSGLDAPSLDERAFCPRGLREELLGRFQGYGFTPAGLGEMMSSGRIDDAVAAWRATIEIQTRAAEYLLETRPVDFFMIVYTASDWAGHNLWENPRAGAGKPGGRSLRSIYESLDGAIARLVEARGPDSRTFLISDHGMGRHTGGSFLLAQWLESNGYLRRIHSPRPGRSLVSAGKSVAKAILPARISKAIKSVLGEERVRQLASSERIAYYESIDWPRTTAYTEPGRHVVNINLAGRNQGGAVPGSDYDRIRDEITAGLLGWRDEAGRNLVERVVKREDAYRGPFVERASDLYINWNPEADAGPPPIEITSRGFWWSGDHRPDGIIVCAGPGIRAGARLTGATVYDFVPTMLYLAGLGIPDGLDGGVIEGLCSDDFTASHPLRSDSAVTPRDGALNPLSPEEEKLIEDKLRGLGYL